MSISVIATYFDKTMYQEYNNVIMRKRVEEEKALVVHPINRESVRSIEEMAKLGMPFSILAKNQQTWLIRGGLEYFKEEKPYLYPLVEKLVENRDRAIPEGDNMRSIAKEVRKKLGWDEDQSALVSAWVERILRWKIEPFHVKSEKIVNVAKALKDVIEEKYRKNPEGYRYLYKSASEWVKWNERMKMYKEGCKDDEG